MTAGIPAVDPSSYDSLNGMMKEVLNTFLMNVDDMLPAIVISFDRTTNRAQVQPVIRMVMTDGTVKSRAPVASVPVLQLGGGNFMLNFPMNPGDLGFIKANDRDISLFMQSFTESPPNTYRKHTFEDAIFIPAPMTGMSIDDEDETHVVLSTLDGTQRVAIWANQVKITSNTKVVIDAPLTEFTGAIINGTNPAYDDYAYFGGNIRTNLDVIAGYNNEDISLLHHTHNGVQTGGGNTGQPNPV